mgnify:CR=1 FL=1
MSKNKDQNVQSARSGVSFIHSIKFKIMAMTGISVIVAIVAMLLIIVPSVQKDIKETINNYMYDVTASYADKLELRLGSYKKSYLNAYKLLNDDFGEVSLNGMESSYAYIVGSDGTMLFHPDQEKVGNPVENDAVKKVVADIAAGDHPELQVIEYTYKGTYKYAACYVDESDSAILVVTVDEDEVLAGLNSVKRKSYVSAVILLVMALAVAVFISLRISNPIIKVSKCLDKLASLDFTEDKDLSELSLLKDETGFMAKSMNGLEKTLSDVIASLKDEAASVRQASVILEEGTSDTAVTIEQVELAVSEISDGATSQANETQRATENVVLMGNLVEENGVELQNLVEVARAMRSSSEAAQATIHTLEEVNRSAVESIGVIAEQTKTTNTSAQKIREATSLITAIAEETNLLSLNASIEAARAGEQGRGFAVVAGQIQKLAEQSNSSAQQIEEVIDELIRDSQNAVETMDQVETVMNRQNENMVQTEQKFSEVADGISASIDSIRIIRDKSAELDKARIEVVDIVQNLTAIAEENAASTQETSASVTQVTNIVSGISGKAEELKTIADDLDEHMSRFVI